MAFSLCCFIRNGSVTEPLIISHALNGLIVATITSLAIGQDRFSWTQTFAIVFICAGVYLVEVAESRDKSPDPLKK